MSVEAYLKYEMYDTTTHAEIPLSWIDFCYCLHVWVVNQSSGLAPRKAETKKIRSLHLGK